MEKRRKMYVKIELVYGKTVKEALDANGTVVAILEKNKEVQQLAEAIGIDFSAPEWSDDEQEEPETRLGY